MWVTVLWCKLDYWPAYLNQNYHSAVWSETHLQATFRWVRKPLPPEAFPYHCYMQRHWDSREVVTASIPSPTEHPSISIRQVSGCLLAYWVDAVTGLPGAAGPGWRQAPGVLILNAWKQTHVLFCNSCDGPCHPHSTTRSPAVLSTAATVAWIHP